jgi:hypothetical protein
MRNHRQHEWEGNIEQERNGEAERLSATGNKPALKTPKQKKRKLVTGEESALE